MEQFAYNTPSSDLLSQQIENVIEENSTELAITIAQNLQLRFVPLPEIGKITPTPSATKIVKTLISDMNRSEEMINTIGKNKALTHLGAERMLNDIPNKDFDSEYDGMINALRYHVPDYFKELDDVGIAAALTKSLDFSEFGPWIEVCKPYSERARNLGYSGKGASYYPLIDKIVIVDDKPTDKQLWESIAVNSYLPEFITKLDHEANHDLQMEGVIARARAIFNGDESPERLPQELQALLASAASPTHPHNINEPSGLNSVNLFNKLKPLYFPHLEDGQYHILAQSVYDKFILLRTLGLDDRQLALIVKNCRYDQDLHTYPAIDEAVEREKNLLGIKDDQDFNAIITNLKLMQELKFYYSRAQAQYIAIKQLRIASGRSIHELH